MVIAPRHQLGCIHTFQMWGFLKWEYPIKWIFFHGKSKKLMITGGSPILGNHHVYLSGYDCCEYQHDAFAQVGKAIRDWTEAGLGDETGPKKVPKFASNMVGIIFILYTLFIPHDPRFPVLVDFSIFCWDCYNMVSPSMDHLHG